MTVQNLLNILQEADPNAELCVYGEWDTVDLVDVELSYPEGYDRVFCCIEVTSSDGSRSYC